MGQMRESAHRLVIRAHLAEGNIGEARRQFEHCRLLLREELGVHPSGELCALLIAGRGDQDMTDTIEPAPNQSHERLGKPFMRPPAKAAGAGAP